jgi:hypothetical protein
MKTRGQGYIGTNARAMMIQEEMQRTKVKRKHDYLSYASVASLAFALGAWAGVVLTNGTWSWS